MAYRVVAVMRSLEYQRADAQLIAAAPELLEALEQIVRVCRELGVQQERCVGDLLFRQPLAAATTAISKALGQGQ
jgi:hypothetical protein